jgi:hypothetical protein
MIPKTIIIPEIKIVPDTYAAERKLMHIIKVHENDTVIKKIV